MRWFPAIALCGLLGACQSNPVHPLPPSTGSETHWLESCTADSVCEAGSQCICGICTRTCTGDALCAPADRRAVCAPPRSAELAGVCGAVPPDTDGLCVLACADDAGCKAGQTCVDGACTAAPPAAEPVATARALTLPVPRKPAVDFLFVIDNSGSMCEEQARLTERFMEFAPRLTRVDYRVAVVSTDMHPPNGHLGRFLAEPATPEPQLNCLDAEGAPFTADTADCADLVDRGELPTVLSAVEGYDEASLAQRFRCLATLGTGGDGFERGLEAMRTALACTGPNAARFGACCRGGAYDAAACDQPEFLRPDASLVVVVVSDENDCSAPADAPLSRSENSNCEWFRDDLVPVAEYRDFLRSLKGEPARVSVWAFVGDRTFTELGDEVFYDQGRPAPICDPGAPEFDDTRPLSECCPEGRCRGPIQPSCSSELGTAYPGRRYAELADAFPTGCSPDHDAECTLCAGDFGIADAFEARAPVFLHAWCLDPPPACLVAAGDGLRPCTEDEGGEPRHYAVAIEVTCDGCATPIALEPDDWTLAADARGCEGGALLRLRTAPPPGGTVTLRYRSAR